MSGHYEVLDMGAAKCAWDQPGLRDDVGYLNLDVKKVWIKTKVSAGGAELGTFKVDPVLFGVGYRF